mmetsp:Transcript_3668/g.13553  ORF Transcript_3668/g.13553 Transcript_3668/m.13553 type:complete len:217 (-) Transcript_3668:2615-3265(-)
MTFQQKRLQSKKGPARRPRLAAKTAPSLSRRTNRSLCPNVTSPRNSKRTRRWSGNRARARQSALRRARRLRSVVYFCLLVTSRYSRIHLRSSSQQARATRLGTRARRPWSPLRVPGTGMRVQFALAVLPAPRPRFVSPNRTTKSLFRVCEKTVPLLYPRFDSARPAFAVSPNATGPFSRSSSPEVCRQTRITREPCVSGASIVTPNAGCHTSSRPG